MNYKVRTRKLGDVYYCQVKPVEIHLEKCIGDDEEAVIPDGVNVIIDEAFAECKHLKSVVIPDTVQAMYLTAFWNCPELKEIKIPASVIDIKYFGWTSADYLEAIHVSPDNSRYSSVDGVLLDKEEAVVVYCPPFKMGKFEIPKGIKTIGKYAFEECVLEEVVIPDTVTHIDYQAFQNCKKLKRIVLPDSVNSISQDAFRGCEALESVRLPKKLKELSLGTFAGCGLREINLPEGLFGIAENVFCGCHNLAHIKLPSSLCELGEGSLHNCPKLVVELEGEPFPSVDFEKKKGMPFGEYMEGWFHEFRDDPPSIVYRSGYVEWCNHKRRWDELRREEKVIKQKISRTKGLFSGGKKKKLYHYLKKIQRELSDLKPVILRGRNEYGRRNMS